MKTLCYEDGREWLETMTVADLINELSKYDPELPILPTWESVYTRFHADNFRLVTLEWPVPGINILEIDVDQWT